MYSSSRELITLQFGDYANHVASNFWNIEYTNATFTNDSKSSDNDVGTRSSDNSTTFDKSTQSSHTNPYHNDAHKKHHQKSKLVTKNSGISKQGSSAHSQITKYIESSHRANIDGNICFFNKKQHLNTNATKYSTRESDESGNTSMIGEYMPRTIIFASSGSEGDILKEIEYFDNKSYKMSSNSSNTGRSYAQTQRNSRNSLLWSNPSGNSDLDSIFTWNNRITTFHTPAYHAHQAIHSQLSVQLIFCCVFWIILAQTYLA